MAAPLVQSNLHPDSIAPPRVQHKLSRMTFNVTAVSCRTFSLGHILIDYVFGAATEIVHGNPDSGDEDGCDSARRPAKLDTATASRKQHLPSKPLRWGCSNINWGQRRRFDESESTIEQHSRRGSGNHGRLKIKRPASGWVVCTYKISRKTEQYTHIGFVKY